MGARHSGAIDVTGTSLYADRVLAMDSSGMQFQAANLRELVAEFQRQLCGHHGWSYALRQGEVDTRQGCSRRARGANQPRSNFLCNSTLVAFATP